MLTWQKWAIGVGAGVATLLLGRKIFAGEEATTYDQWGIEYAKGRGVYWPVVTENKVIPAGSLAFHASRKSGTRSRIHAGVDVYAANGDTVVAAEDGVLIGHAGGYVGLDALVIQHEHCTILYGEMIAEPTLRNGQSISAGQVIGTVVNSKGTSPDAVLSSMLHLETWENGHGPKYFTPWYSDSPMPSGLLDPMLYLQRTLRG